jgi:energy-coupling factor transporter transmembrane protein EcfT
MLQLSFLDYFSAFTISGTLFFVLIFVFWCGYVLRKWTSKQHPNPDSGELGSISSALLGLLALILAFTFSMANSRYDERRQLAIQEANAIGTVFLRTEFFPDSVQKELKQTLKIYHQERVSFFTSGMDVEKIILSSENSDKFSKILWDQVTDFAKKDLNLVKTSEIVPALNEMIDLTLSRKAAGEANIPSSIQSFLIILCISSTFLLGYERKAHFDWILVVCFSLLLSLTVFSIIDLDRPRSGLVTLDEANLKIIELKALFE